MPHIGADPKQKFAGLHLLDIRHLNKEQSLRTYGAFTPLPIPTH
jgi:hypothetical protein